MNMRAIVDNFTPNEQNELYDIIYEKKKERAKGFANGIELTEEEKNVFINSTVEAVKAIRTRLNCSFLEAKAVLDNYVNSLKK